jgi:hypothetical protein
MDWATHRSTAAGFVLEYPAGWSVVEGIVGAAVILMSPEQGAGRFTANVSVSAQELPGVTTLADFSAAQLVTMERLLTDVRLVDRSEGTLLGQPAERVLVSYRQGVHALALEQWWGVAARNPGAVVVAGTCAALDYDGYADIFARVARSLRPNSADDG